MTFFILIELLYTLSASVIAFLSFLDDFISKSSGDKLNYFLYVFPIIPSLSSYYVIIYIPVIGILLTTNAFSSIAFFSSISRYYFLFNFNYLVTFPSFSLRILSY